MSNWRKSAYSTNNGACIEVGDWRKSSRSSYNGNCVEVGYTAGVAVRDTKQAGRADRTVLEFPASAWAAFTESLKETAV